MKAIETVYNGYRFRSRLEARWAVFFSTAGIKFEYEPEGFQFSDGTRYLPDFYLPWFRCYIEIKPSSIFGEELSDAKRKCRKLVEEGGECIALLCIGDPYDWNVVLFCNDMTDGSAGTSEWDADFFEGCHYNNGWFDSKHCIRLCVLDNSRSDRSYHNGDWSTADIKDFKNVVNVRSDLSYAKAKARQARFEFGE